MGSRVIALAAGKSGLQIVAGVEASGTPSFARFTPDGKAPVVTDIREVLPKTDVVIDFTTAAAVLKTARAAAKARRPLVIGTTGLKPAAVRELKSLSRRIPIVLSPNMSVGVNTLFGLVRRAAGFLADYDIEIVEAHHNQKKDSPSGTALRLAEVAAAASRRSEKDFVYGRKGLVGPRKKKEIGIHALRAGDIVGDHTVLFSSAGERLELTHRAHSRDAFAAGALQAASWAAHRRPGFYSMEDVLFSSFPRPVP